MFGLEVGIEYPTPLLGVTFLLAMVTLQAPHVLFLVIDLVGKRKTFSLIC